MRVKGNCIPITEFYASNFKSKTLRRSQVLFMPYTSPTIIDVEGESGDPELFFCLSPPLVFDMLSVLSFSAAACNLEQLNLLWSFEETVDQLLIQRLLYGLITLPRLKILNIDLHERVNGARLNPAFVGSIKPFLTHPDNQLEKLTLTFHKGVVKIEEYKELILCYDIQRSNVKRYELLFDNVEALVISPSQQLEIFAEVSERFDWMLRAAAVKITGVLRGVLRYFSCRNTYDRICGDKDFREIYISDTVLRTHENLSSVILKSLEVIERYGRHLLAINLHFDPRGNPIHMNIFRKIDDILMRFDNLQRINVDVGERTLSIVEKQKNLTFLCLMMNPLVEYNIRKILNLLRKLPYLTFFDTLNMRPNERVLVRSVTQQFFKEKNLLLSMSYALRNSKSFTKNFKVRQAIRQDLFVNFLMEGVLAQNRLFQGGF